MSNLQSEISSLAASVPEFDGGGISGFIDALLRSNIDVLSNPAVQRAIVDAKLFLNDVAANVIQSTPDKVAKDPDVALEHLRAIAEAVGKDRRGAPVYVRDDDGAEILYNETQERATFTPSGELISKSRKVRVKHLDDDLPKVSKAYRDYLDNAK